DVARGLAREESLLRIASFRSDARDAVKTVVLTGRGVFSRKGGPLLHSWPSTTPPRPHCAALAPTRPAATPPAARAGDSAAARARRGDNATAQHPGAGMWT